jgi:hypothetical protein
MWRVYGEVQSEHQELDEPQYQKCVVFGRLQLVPNLESRKRSYVQTTPLWATSKALSISYLSKYLECGAYKSSFSSSPRSSNFASPSITAPMAIPISLTFPPRASTKALSLEQFGSARCPRSVISNMGRAGSDSVRVGL